MDRRNFIYRAGRYGMLAGLIVLGAFGINKRLKIPAGECVLQEHCKTCTKLTSCDLPQATRQKALQ